MSIDFYDPIGMCRLPGSPPGTIDGLVGTIDAQAGTIDSLGVGTTQVVPALLFFDESASQLKIGVTGSTTAFDALTGTFDAQTGTFDTWGTAASYRHVVS